MKTDEELAKLITDKVVVELCSCPSLTRAMMAQDHEDRMAMIAVLQETVTDVLECHRR